MLQRRSFECCPARAPNTSECPLCRCRPLMPEQLQRRFQSVGAQLSRPLRHYRGESRLLLGPRSWPGWPVRGNIAPDLSWSGTRYRSNPATPRRFAQTEPRGSRNQHCGEQRAPLILHLRPSGGAAASGFSLVVGIGTQAINPVPRRYVSPHTNSPTATALINKLGFGCHTGTHGRRAHGVVQ